jgi:hypothetical protein
MKKLISSATFCLVFLFLFSSAYAQDSTYNSEPGKNWKAIDLSNRPNDHVLLQFGYDGWGSLPDSINTSGFSRHFNFYIMIDKPFKNSPHFSFAFGLGIGSSNIFFDNTYVDIKSPTPTLPFKDVSNENHFKKFKLTTVFLELPIEFRFASNPAMPDKGMKFAIGAKGGALINTHTKGKNLVDKDGNSLYGDKYIEKQFSNRFINSTRLAVTARVGIGHFSLDGSYQVTNFLKENSGPTIHPYSIGLTLSGL